MNGGTPGIGSPGRSCTRVAVQGRRPDVVGSEVQAGTGGVEVPRRPGPAVGPVAASRVSALTVAVAPMAIGDERRDELLMAGDAMRLRQAGPRTVAVAAVRAGVVGPPPAVLGGVGAGCAGIARGG